jgi:mannose-6-phosphate isomerase
VIDELLNVVQPYAWGSHTALAELRGQIAPSDRPEAELWMGAHPLAPSRLATSGQTLPNAIEAAPDEYLGARVRGDYGAKLPFLLKVLAAGTPLSLQAHPSIDQARRGYAADDAAGIPLTAANRNYKDQNHKPELLCALSEFWALCGFREVSQTLTLLDTLNVAELLPYRALLAAEPSEVGISKVFSSLMQLPPARARALAEVTAQACQARLGQGSRFGNELRWAARLSELYSGDIGVVSALLLNLLRLAPGEAVYLPAGNLHAYLGGIGVEIMASSDNVLRGGLTPKHVDVPELLHVLDFRPLHVTPLRAQANGNEHVYPTPAQEFCLSYFDCGHDTGVIDVCADGPEIWLVTEGSFQLSDAHTPPVTLTRARSAFVSAATGTLQLRGAGRIFRARVAPSTTPQH